jgi:NADPH:quinone reductase-like Zn-dependent oxidoreductase
MHLEIERSDIRHSRMSATEPRTLEDGEVLLSVERFALTSNNVSYALSGDFLDYWGFFPTQEGWGRLPVMGFGVVTDTTHPNITVGQRYFGFFPAGDFHIVQAQKTSGGFVDIAPHREKHAMAYRSFDDAAPSLTDTDNAYLLLRGLYVTSFLAEDFLFDNGMFGAGQIVVSSASSKTAIALAQCIRARGNTHCIGLTSHSNLDFVNTVNLYDEVATYDDIENLAEWAPTIYVDIAGNNSVTTRVHAHFSDALQHSMKIGATHWDQGGQLGDLAGPIPQFFFAPTQLAKRGKEWGRDVLNTRLESSLRTFIDDSNRWLHVEESRGGDELMRVYHSLISGESRPELGHIIIP